MAIYVDGLQLQPKKDGTSLERKYYQDREEIKQLFGKFRKANEPVTLIFQRDFQKKLNQKRTSYRPIPAIAIPLVVNYYDEQVGAIEVRYSTSPPRKVSGRLLWNKGSELIDEIYAVSENQMDLAWFLLKASPFFQSGVLKLVDLGVEIETKWDAMLVQTDVAKFLFDKDLSDGRLAQVYGVFLGGKYTYDESDTVAGNALRLWTVAMNQSQSGDVKVMNSLRSAINQTTPKEDQDLGVVEVDGKEFPVIQTPVGWFKDSILKEYARYGFEVPKKIMKNDVLYTILQARISLLEQQ